MRPIPVRLLPLAAVLAALPLLAACSGSGDNGPTPTARPNVVQSLAPLQPQPEPVQALDATVTQPKDGVASVTAQNAAFSPNLLAATTGSTITIRLTNKDGQAHSLRIAGPDGQYQTDDDAVTEPSTVAAGETGELTFAPLVAGSYTFRCDFHPGSMGGQIRVTSGTP